MKQSLCSDWLPQGQDGLSCLHKIDHFVPARKKDGLGTQSPPRDTVNFSFVDECGLKLILLIMMLFLDVMLLGIMSLSFPRKNMMLTSSFRF